MKNRKYSILTYTHPLTSYARERDREKKNNEMLKTISTLATVVATDINTRK